MDTVCGDLAEIGYDTEWHCIPAANVGAPHLRDRIWIVAHSDAGRRGTDIARGNDTDGADAGRTETDGVPGEIRQNGDKREMAAVADMHGQGRLQPAWLFRYLRRWIDDGAPAFAGWENPWPQVLSEISRMDDGVSTRMDRLGCDALGNTIIPQIPEMIGRAIMLAEGHSAQDF
jgi:DNA (cytosine-5)-methyltransferase 1